MRSILFSALFLSLVSLGSANATTDEFDPHYHWTPCVGGPARPSYAFSSWHQARICRDMVARQSQACARMVRMATCHALHYSINSVSPYACVCNPGGYSVGHW